MPAAKVPALIVVLGTPSIHVSCAVRHPNSVTKVGAVVAPTASKVFHIKRDSIGPTCQSALEVCYFLHALGWILYRLRFLY